MMLKKRLQILVLILLPMLFHGLGSTYAKTKDGLKLRYDSPADSRVWEQALALGNGRLGAMVYGIPPREEIQLNEETLYAGGPYRNDHASALEALPQIRKFIFQGKGAEADKLANQAFFTQANGMPFQTAGSVVLNFKGHENYRNYYRELDIENAIAFSRYMVDGITYTREVFASFADDVIVMQITASKKGALNFDVEYKNPSEHRIFAQGDRLVLEGKGTSHEGIAGKIVYRTHTSVKNKDGKVTLANNSMKISNATSVVVYISIATNFLNYNAVGADAEERASKKLDVAQKKGFKLAKKQHTAIYNKQFGRFKLHLGEDSAAKSLTTTARIASFRETEDPSLVALLAQFGRYLLICSSQPGGQPANLQGIWNNSLRPAWDSKYTVNINTEMNYWPAEVTNLSDNHTPLLEMVRELSQSGRETARKLYGAEGWVTHHNTDLWRVTSPIDFAAAGMWPTGGTWLAQHIWEHYLFTGNKTFLADFYPVMKGASDFLLTTLIEHPMHKDKRWLVLSPSVSPEHGPLSAGVTMDNQLIFDMLTRTALASEVLGVDPEYRIKLRAVAKRIPPMQIGKYGQLQEWLEDRDDPRSDHRHVSHLYGLYPGNQISPYSTPELFEAARNALIHRGDFATGWSIGWKVNLWARLQDGNHAYKIIENMLTLASPENKDGRTYPNMFTAHPPFQIDGNFGLTAGVAEMIVQSHDGAVHLLPALPDTWSSGSVSGLIARGGFEVQMTWDDGNVAHVRVRAKVGGNLRLRSYTPLKGKGLTEATGSNSNLLYKQIDVPKALISQQTRLKGNDVRRVYEYDIATIAGRAYTFSSTSN